MVNSSLSESCLGVEEVLAGVGMVCLSPPKKYEDLKGNQIQLVSAPNKKLVKELKHVT